MKKILICIAVLVGTVGSFVMLRATHNGARVHQDLTSFQGIEGRVVDSEGNPVEAVQVVVAPTLTGLLLGATTNKDGYFAVNAVSEGMHEVWTQENDSDISPTGLFFSGGLPQRHVANVYVLAGQVTSNVVLETPPKLAKLAGRVFDATTNQRIVAYTITLRRVDHPDYYMQMGPDEDGSFDIPVPPVAITVEITTTAHQPWNYVLDDPAPDLSRPVPLKPGPWEPQKLEVRLLKKVP